MLLCCQGALRGWSDTTEMGHSCEGKLLLGHVPRWVVGGGVDRSFVEQPVVGVGRFKGQTPPLLMPQLGGGRRCLKTSRATYRLRMRTISPVDLPSARRRAT